MKIFIDFETRSELDITKVGADVYSRHPSTDVLCVAWARDNGPVYVRERVELPAFWMEPFNFFAAHGAAFELAIWNNILTPRYGWPEVTPKDFECTMAMCYAMSLPGKLEMAALALGLDIGKDMRGRRVMMQLCKPRSYDDQGKSVWWDDMAKTQALMEYCKKDVEVTRGLYKRLQPLSPQERKIWLLDQAINRRGVAVDVELAKKAVAVVEAETLRLDKEMERLTDGFVPTCGSNIALQKYLTQGRENIVLSVDKASVLDMLAGKLEPVSPHHKKILTLRQEAGKSSTAKLQTMLNCSSYDGRLRGLFQYHGANTGRWAGRNVQLQNLPRGKLPHETVDKVLALLRGGGTGDDIDNFFGPPLDTISSCIRAFLTAKQGCVFIAVDYGQIESRVRSWLAGDEKLIDVYRGDGKVYEHTAAGIYGIPPEAVTKEQRQIGKTADLALGFGGGVGAFQTMAKNLGVKVTDEKAEQIKVAWRRNHPTVVRFWKDLERGAIEAVLSSGVQVRSGKYIRWVKKGSFLWCELPSKRILCYPYPKIVGGKFGNDALQYMSIDSFTKKWDSTDTYGGSLCENVVQAVARDILAEAMLRLSKAYDVVMHIHDEFVIEINEAVAQKEWLNISRIAAEPPIWAKDLPLTVEGWIGERYRK